MVVLIILPVYRSLFTLLIVFHVLETINIKDYGDITPKKNNKQETSCAKNMLKLNDVSCFTSELSDACYTILNDQRMCITLGGDHSIAIGK